MLSYTRRVVVIINSCNWLVGYLFSVHSVDCNEIEYMEKLHNLGNLVNDPAPVISTLFFFL